MTWTARDGLDRYWAEEFTKKVSDLKSTFNLPEKEATVAAIRQLEAAVTARMPTPIATEDYDEMDNLVKVALSNEVTAKRQSPVESAGEELEEDGDFVVGYLEDDLNHLVTKPTFAEVVSSKDHSNASISGQPKQRKYERSPPRERSCRSSGYRQDEDRRSHYESRDQHRDQRSRREDRGGYHDYYESQYSDRRDYRDYQGYHHSRSDDRGHGGQEDRLEGGRRRSKPYERR